MNGKTVEITNTDAEGRLILGDAMTWAERQGATHLVDVATLTGAVARALGEQHDRRLRRRPQAWWDEVAAAGARQGERYWQLPLVDDYRADDGLALRRHRQLRHRRGLARQERHVPQGVRDQALGAPRHRGHRLPPQGDPWTAQGATGVIHATLVELALDESGGLMSTLGETDPGRS